MKNNTWIAILFAAALFACKKNNTKEFEITTGEIPVVVQSPIYEGNNVVLLEIPIDMEEIATLEKINYKIIYHSFLEQLTATIPNEKHRKSIQQIDFSLYNHLRNPTKIAEITTFEQQNLKANVVKNNDAGDFFQDNSLFLLTDIHFKNADSSNFEMQINLTFKVKSEKQ